MSDKLTELNKNINPEKVIKTEEIKTTNVNILLNRVREDKKKIFKKKLLNSLLLITLITSLAIFFTI